MCPYFDKINNSCKLYDTRQTEYHIRTHCLTYEYIRCANYTGYHKWKVSNEYKSYSCNKL